MVGIANIVGRLVIGFIADIKCVNRVMLYNTSLVIAGLFSVASVALWTFPLQMVYAFVYGFSIGASQ